MRYLEQHYSSLLAFLLLAVTIIASAMPPHPELVQRIRNHEVEEPFFLAHDSEIAARGVNTAPRIKTIQELMRRSLDENLNIIAILVDFNDHPAHVEASNFDDLLFGNETGTLRHYYSQVSYGNLTLVTLNLPSAIEWTRMPHTYNYYVDGQNGFGNYPRNAQKLAEDAVIAVNPVVDFSHYDNDGDGYVDALFVIHSGAGAELTGNGNDIWSHMWSMSQEQHVDGVIADIYSMEPEFWRSYGDMTCGVYAHEMGHSVFGLPDFYDYGYDSEGLGRWSLMAGGSWNGAQGASPAHPDAWCRIQMGFVTPTIVTSNLSGVSFPQIESSPAIFRLWTNGQQGSEYFLIENRQQTGYDVAIPSNGLLIYHVDETEFGNDNQWYPGHTNEGNYQVALEQSDGQWNLEHNANQGDAGDPYPSDANHRVFTLNTVPDSRSYNTQDTQVSVRHISASGATMTANLHVTSSGNTPVFVWIPDTFAIAGDQFCVPVDVENSVTGRNITSFQFTVSFNPTLMEMVPPYFDRTAAMVPQSWSVVENYSAGIIQITASGSTPLTGFGRLICLQFRLFSSAQNGATSPFAFTYFVLNTGTPAADTTNGSLRVVAPLMDLHPDTLDFGTIQIGHRIPLGLVIRSIGDATLVVDSIVVSAPFTTDFSGPQNILPNEWRGVRVWFEPTAEQLYLDTLRIYNNTPESPYRLAVAGTGSLLSVGDANTAIAIPLEFYLAQNYPNPFNPTTTFEFGVPTPSHVMVRVHDVTGREIGILFDDLVQAGRHQVVWNCGNCSSGIYFVSMSGAGFRLARKATLLH